MKLHLLNLLKFRDRAVQEACSLGLLIQTEDLQLVSPLSYKLKCLECRPRLKQ